MFNRVTKTIFGDPNERSLKKYRGQVEEINAFEPAMQALSDAQLRAKTDEFRKRLADGENLDDLLHEAFAVVREAGWRVLGMRHYDVQMIGGMVLHSGQIAEMKTGEGKTLVGTLPMYLNALTGRGVHLVTPNDYLSKVGLQLMGPLYQFLGLSAAVIQNQGGDPTKGSFMFDAEYHSEDARYEKLRPIKRAEAYAADITYGTNNEFGFDYLRDNMVLTTDRMVQRDHYFAIVDEIDNILIDEARTPLIISGTADKPSDLYGYVAKVLHSLRLQNSSDESVEFEEPDGDYVYDVKDRTVYLTEQGIEKVEKRMRSDGVIKEGDLYSPENAEILPYLDNSLRAHVSFENDKHYVIENGQIVIVDEFTGRMMHGRRFSEGLHQAIEAKEGVEIRRENVTLATITFQNFFRMYDKLAGMTGTALTEASEFDKIYDLEVTAIPTHVPVIRDDQQDLIFMNEKYKFKAVVADLAERYQTGQPVLVGTTSIETSERLAKELDKVFIEVPDENGKTRKQKVPYEILNAKQHFREADIIAQAGRPGAITIATNMAGRGVDILLGGNPDGLARAKLRQQGMEVTEAPKDVWEAALEEAEAICAKGREQVLSLGGLYVLGTERHEARRIDNQLRGRAGRQGDPGVSRFYLSLEDDLMRRFGGDRVKNFMKWADMPEDMPIEQGMISKSIQQAQVRVEGHNFDIRKRLLDYDDVVNKQREDIYALRQSILFAEPADLRAKIHELIEEGIGELVDTHLAGAKSSWDLRGLYQQAMVFRLPLRISPESWEGMSDEEIEEDLYKGAMEAYAQQIEGVGGEESMTRIEREIYLRVMDELWVRHLTDLAILREGIGLQSLRQRDPLVEYQIEGFQMYNALKEEVKSKVARVVYNAAQAHEQVRRIQVTKAEQPQITATSGSSNGKTIPEPVRATKKDQLGRNDPCHCGSGKKYKHCHYHEDRKQRQTVSQDKVRRTVKRRR